jgi:hypothetical protein
MIKLSYEPPFELDLPVDNPWDGRHSVSLLITPRSPPIADAAVDELRSSLALFTALADAGGLSGSAAPPWKATFKTPEVVVNQGVVNVRFAPADLDEKATACLFCVLLSMHESVPLGWVSLSASGSKKERAQSNPMLTNPYPGLWRDIPFPHEIEESESDTRILRAQFAKPLDAGEVEGVQVDLRRWAGAAAAGLFAIAPYPPGDCGCLPVDSVECYQAELIWPIEKCRFEHRAALTSLVSVCAAIHYRVARIVDVTVE